tara:strand:- start:2958 stop:3245 length:288 start_codon:yes stop_codon:yes gene_type:complete
LHLFETQDKLSTLTVMGKIAPANVAKMGRNSVPFKFATTDQPQLKEFEEALAPAVAVLTCHYRLLLGSRAASSGLALMGSSPYVGSPWTSVQRCG